MALEICGQETVKYEEEKGEDLQLCRICFTTVGSLCSMKMDKSLEQAYGALTGLSIQNEDNMPSYLCTECSEQLIQCFQFRNRSLRAHLLLLEILRKHDCITLEAIKIMNECQHMNTCNLDVTHNSLSQYNFETVNNIKKETEETETLLFRNECHSQVDLVCNNFKNESICVPTQSNSKEEDTMSTSSLHEDNFLDEIKAENEAAYYDDDVAGDKPCNKYSNAFDDDDGSSISKLKGTSKTKTPEDLNETSKLLRHFKPRNSTLKYTYTTNGIQKNKYKRIRISCDLCRKTYSTTFGLKKHMKSHSGEKPYSCDVCEKKFKEKRDLQNHSRIHSGEKPYGCDLCKKSFSERGNLLRHIRIHSGEKPFSCNFCKKSYNQRHHLKRHMTKHY